MMEFPKAVRKARRCSRVVQRHCTAVALLAAVVFADANAFAQSAESDGGQRAWQVEIAPAAEGADDPWRARTIMLNPVGRAETPNVNWLAGLQQQASHLGMGPEAGRDAPADETLPLAMGITRLVRTIPMLGQSVRDLIGHPLNWTMANSSEPDFTHSAGASASFDGPLDGRASAVSALTGAERRHGSLASAAPCPHETCFGPSLIQWNPELSTCTKDVRIGVIDTSFDLSHPAFKRLRVVRKEFIDGATPSDEDWHGTAVLSLLAGDPASGTPGLVPDATFLLATAFRSDAQGNASADPARLLEALNWLDQLDVDIVNMSFAGPPDPTIARVIERMSFKGVIFVAAAGNMGPAAGPSYPGAYPHVIAVTAVNRDGQNYRNASRGDYIDVAAPGVDVLTALPNGKQGLQTGTSFAAPFVTAILATRAASDIVEGTEDLLLERISTRDLGQPGRDPVYGAGMVIAPQQCLATEAVAQNASSTAPKKVGKRKATLKAGVADFRW